MKTGTKSSVTHSETEWKAKPKPNGWEEKRLENGMTIGEILDYVNCDFGGLDVKDFIHQAILSAEEAKVRECSELYEKLQETKYYKELSYREKQVYLSAVEDVTQALSLPDQDQLLNTKTE